MGQLGIFDLSRRYEGLDVKENNRIDDDQTCAPPLSIAAKPSRPSSSQSWFSPVPGCPAIMCVLPRASHPGQIHEIGSGETRKRRLASSSSSIEALVSV